MMTVLTCALVLVVSAGLEASSRRRTGGARQDRPGQFDYYLMSLSWSPQYCSGDSGSRDPQQCGEGRRYGFVVHGLWPQYEHGYPQACGQASPVPAPIVDAMLPLMPSPRLIQHEWSVHGTCSGLGVGDYFGQIRKAFETVHIPDAFRQPGQQVTASASAIGDQFAQANAGFPRQAFRVQCSGRYLSEVRVCLTRELGGRACGADVRDSCRVDSIIVRPLR